MEELEEVEEVWEVVEAEAEDGEVGRFVTVEGGRVQRNCATKERPSVDRVEWASVVCFL